jgi:EAL domain-containing protein (putative c-di-GMP-specific phosphodiesterase class I)
VLTLLREPAELVPGPMTMAYQPVQRLSDGKCRGYEALCRFPESTEPVDRVFAEATARGTGVDLERAALVATLGALPLIAADQFLAVNLSPAALLSPQVQTILELAESARLVVEITEHAPVVDYDDLNQVLRPLRENGLRVAIDDAGAGYACFGHVLALRPDFVKLDIALVRGVHQDSQRRSLIASLLGFVDEVGMELVAEGIEEPGELVCLCDLGVHFGQGYLLGRPSFFI